MKKQPEWKMPDWMEQYRDLFGNTGGNTVEELMNRDPRDANVVVNAPLALICVAVENQVGILTRLYNKGLLVEGHALSILCDREGGRKE